MPAQFMSEIASIKPSRRAAAYRGLLKRRNLPDDLQNRITAQVDLTDEDVQEITALLTKGCSARTTYGVRLGLLSLLHGPSYSAFSRVVKTQYGWEYCAGQSYTEEIARLRGLLMK